MLGALRLQGVGLDCGDGGKFLTDEVMFRGRLAFNMRCFCASITMLTQDKGSLGSEAEGRQAIGLEGL